MGQTLDEQTIHLSPLKSIDFQRRDLQLAGTRLDVRVEAGWTRALVDGRPAALPLNLPRSTRYAKLEFLR